MKTLIKILLAASVFFLPKLSKAQENTEINKQYIGTVNGIVVSRNVLRSDSALEFPITDTSKHPSRPGRLTSFNGTPYWWNGIYWARISGDTSRFAGQVNADWTATTGVAFIENKPTFAAVATSGSYTDLTSKPTIPAAQVNVDWSAASGITQVLNKPRMIDSIWRIPGEDSIRVRVRNADNTFRTFAMVDSINTGGGGGSGTVTLVSAGNLTPIFGTTVNNASTTPSIVFTLTNAPAHTFLGDTTGSAAAPRYLPISVADLPGSIPVSKTLLSALATTGIVLTGNQLTIDTTSVIATLYDVSLKQNQLNGTGYIKQSGTTPSYQTNTQLTADVNLFTTSLKGLVPAPTTVQGFVLSDNGTWVAQSGSGTGAQSISGDATGSISGTNIPIVLANVNPNAVSSLTLLKFTVNGKGLVTSTAVAGATDITGALGYTPYHSNDTLTTLATKSDLAKIDSIPIVPSPSAGSAPVAIYGGQSTIFAKRFINGVQNSDSSITVGNVIAANNLNDLANKNSGLNNLLPSQTGNSGKSLVTDGTNTSWVTISGGGSGTTNISITQSAVADTVKSSTGTPGVLPLVNYSLAGAEAPGDKKRTDSSVNFANTRVGDTLAYMSPTLDTIWFKGNTFNSASNSIVVTKTITQKNNSYSIDINPAATFYTSITQPDPTHIVFNKFNGQADTLTVNGATPITPTLDQVTGAGNTTLNRINSGFISITNSVDGQSGIAMFNKTGTTQKFQFSKAADTQPNEIALYDDSLSRFVFTYQNDTFSIPNHVTIADGTQGLNKVFTSDANGNGSWQNRYPVVIASQSFFALTNGGQGISTSTLIAGTYSGSVYLNVTATSGSATYVVEATYTDPNNVAQTYVMIPSGQTSGNITATGHYYYAEVPFRIKAGTTIGLAITQTAGVSNAFTYDISFVAEMLGTL